MKTRSDAVLKQLAEQSQEFGETLAAWCRTKKTEEHSGGLQYAIEQLAAGGKHASLRQVSEFFSWWEMRESFQKMSSRTENFEALLKLEFPDASPEKIAGMTQLHFEILSSNAGNSEDFVNLQYLRLAKESAATKAAFEKQKIALRKQAEERAEKKLQFEVNKYLDLAAGKLLDKALRSKADELNASDMSQADKIAAMRKAAFSDVDALQASGKVQIPKT